MITSKNRRDNFVSLNLTFIRNVYYKIDWEVPKKYNIFSIRIKLIKIYHKFNI